MKKKIIVIGDLHLGKFGDDISLFVKFILKVVLPQCDKDTILVFVGDQFETSNANIVLLNAIIEIFNKIHNTVHSAYFLIGNHDTWKHEDISVNMSAIFSVYPNFKVIENDIVEINNKKFHFLSFHKDINKIRAAVESSDAHYLVCHEEINEFFYDKFRPINGGIGLTELEKFEVVFNGHIHRKQTKTFG